MKKDYLKFQEILEELNSELYDYIEEPDTEFAYASNGWCDYIFLPQFSLMDSENYSLEGMQDVYKEMLVNVSKLEKIFTSYRKILESKIIQEAEEDEDFPLTGNPAAFAKLSDEVERLGLGENDLDKPDQFDNKRFM
jgi:hypothetical protein